MEEEGQSGPEKQDQVPDEQQEGPTQQAGGTTVVRSYECNFCKRGFTNAQALGGHMNIHRRDKAKLKQSSTPPTSQPQHFPPSTFFPSPNVFHNPNMDIDQKGAAAGGKWFSSSQEPANRDHKISKISTHEGKQQQQLPLLADQVASRIENQNPPAEAEAEAPELDLELRLGHNIDLPSSDYSSKGTRRFF